MDELNIFVKSGMIICGGLITLLTAVKLVSSTYKDWKAPNNNKIVELSECSKNHEGRISKVENYMFDDEKEKNSMRASLNLILKSIKGILTEMNQDGTKANIRNIEKEIDEYLIGR